jgi:hypothetical protein
LLKDALEQYARASLRRTLLLAIAMLRLDEALEFLLARLAEDSEKQAGDALAALALYSRDDTVRQRIQQILAERKSPALSEVFRTEFSG